MDLTALSKNNKGLLSQKKETQDDIRVGRPKIKKEEEKLDKKITVNINSYEKEFLEDLNRETGIPISTYLRKKLLEVEAFKK